MVVFHLTQRIRPLAFSTIGFTGGPDIITLDNPRDTPIDWVTMSAANASTYANEDVLRTEFAAAMSAMYRTEVPLYGDLIEIVRDINASAQESLTDTKLGTSTPGVYASIERLTQERHGAIRLGTPYELQTIKRIFGLLGMHPIGYYDLSIAGLPMHATCFRPLTVSSLNCNPFRVFTTLLRPELLDSDEARQLSLRLLARRKIFSDQLMQILEQADRQGGRLKQDQTELFVAEALRTFRWQSIAAVTLDEYQTLKAAHPILADIACFQTAHINHLTPRTLDIVAVQSAMKKAGMAAKAKIEGPPPRKCPILLRQTSFLAVEEAVRFQKDGTRDIDASLPQAALVVASHRARFGEIEQRGAAVTPKGRKLYDELLHESRIQTAHAAPTEADAIATRVFKKYPDTWAELRRDKLIYCEFKVTHAPTAESSKLESNSSLETLIAEGIVEATPITYEDFLPLSAAGIFQSNLQSGTSVACKSLDRPAADPKGFEEAMDAEIMDLDSWYAAVQSHSLDEVSKTLGLAPEELVLDTE
ncbi:hypothetical protein F5Y18DRAFT_389148 [Xylariaceae sp. FL1019]|nr:hypothetical protein F5Y18DRAFT_389148 [Xylariaceae sp. FL1019]